MKTKKNKPFTLYLRFETFEQLWKFYENHLPDNTELFKGCSIDPEFGGSGRAPANSIVVREAGSGRTIGGPLKAALVPAED
jgi:hypothetical protein